MISALRSALFVMRLAWQCSPRSAILATLEIVILAVDAMTPLALVLMIGGLASQSLIPLGVGIALLLISFAAGESIIMVAVAHRVRLFELVGQVADQRIMAAVSSAPTLDILDEPAMAEAVEVARARSGAIGFAYNGLVTGFVQLAAPLTSIIVALVLDWRLVLLALVSIPNILIAAKVVAFQQDADQKSRVDAARARAWVPLWSEPTARHERRIYRSAAWQQRVLMGHVVAWRRVHEKATRRESVLIAVGDILYLACSLLMLSWIACDVHAGDVGVEVLVGGLAVAMGLQSAAGGLRYAITTFGATLRTATSVLHVLDRLGTPQPNTAAAQASAHDPASGLAFHNVSYRYAGSDNDAVTNVTFAVEPGTTIALIGENGCGKSTLTQLALGLREPTRGHIVGIARADVSEPASTPDSAEPATHTTSTPGVNTKDSDGSVPRRYLEVSNIPQHVARFEETLGDAVGMSARAEGRAPSPERLDIAVSAAFGESYDSVFPQGCETLLGETHDGGVGLSSGQWQKVALARGVYTSASRMLVLDEPTSALDPHSYDAALMTSLAKAREVQAAGGVVLLVTHKLAFAQHADLILVLEQGRVVEQGSHDELVALGGRYCRDFELQKSGFET